MKRWIEDGRHFKVSLGRTNRWSLPDLIEISMARTSKSRRVERMHRSSSCSRYSKKAYIPAISAHTQLRQ